MDVLDFTVLKKKIECDVKQVVGDNDYQASFMFDEEWDDKEVICRVVWNNTTSLDIAIEDLSCVIPAYIMKHGEVSIGVFVDGDEQLTTSPWKIGVLKSIREKEFETAVPHKAVWDGINEKIKDVVTHIEFDEKVGDKLNAYLGKIEVLVNTLHLPYVTVEMFGAVGDGVTNDSEAFQKAIDFADEHNIPQVHLKEKSYVIENMVYLPCSVSLCGNRATILIKTNEYAFGLNTKGSSWVIAYPNIVKNEFKDITFQNYNKTVYTTAKAILLASPTRIKNIKATYIYRVIEQASLYVDNKFLEELVVEGRLGDYDVDYYLGDGLIINDCFDTKIRMVGCAGAVVNGNINGTFILESCKGITINGYHKEKDGTIVLKNSKATFNDCYFYKTLENPIIDVAQEANCRGSELTLNNVEFNFMPLRYNYENDTPDINVDKYSVLYINNVKRILATEGGHKGMGSDLRINDFYLHPCQTNHCIVKLKNIQSTSDVVNYGNSNYNNLISNIQLIDSENTYADEIGTYYFNQIALFDNVRMLALSLAPTWYERKERSIDITESKGLSFQTYTDTFSDGYLRIYRGKNSGIYNAYIDIPISSPWCDHIHDYDGKKIGAYKYQEREESGLDDVYYIKDYKLKKDGTVEIKGSKIPTVGTWQQGDVIINSNPTAGSDYGWICIEGGTSGTWKSLGKIAE